MVVFKVEFVISCLWKKAGFLSFYFVPWRRTDAQTCIRFMASRIWSRWWAELRASSLISVNFNSFSLSSLFNCRMISASASVHSQILKENQTQNRLSGEARGLGKGMILLKAELQNIHQVQKKFLAAGKTNSKGEFCQHSFIGSKLKTATSHFIFLSCFLKFKNSLVLWNKKWSSELPGGWYG